MTEHAADAALRRHPSTLSAAVRAIGVRARRLRDGTLALTYRLDADLTRLRVPAPSTPQRVDGLWEHTCFEVFVGRDGAAAYQEFNFAPSGDWAAYAFRRYRELGPRIDDAWAPTIQVLRAPDQLDLDAVVRLDGLTPAQATAPLRLALSAVIEEHNGALSYWALQHPPGKPDFHHPDGFVLRLVFPT